MRKLGAISRRLKQVFQIPSSFPYVKAAIENSDNVPSDERVYHGGIWLPSSTVGTAHTFFLGAPGSGKTTLVYLMIRNILRKLRLGTNRHLIFYDAKGEAYPLLIGMGAPQELIHIMDPFDDRGSAWALAKDITSPAAAMEVGTVFVPERNEMQPFFPEAARSLIGGTMEALLQLAPGKWTLRDVVVVLRERERLIKVLSLVKSTRHLPDKFIRGNETTDSIVGGIENIVRRLSFVAAAWEHAPRSVSVDEWIRGESIFLLSSNPMLESTLIQLNKALLHRVSQAILSQPEARHQMIPPQFWIVIDELRLAGKLDFLPKFLVGSRSKGGCAVLAAQDLEGVCDTYGDHLGYEIVGIPRNKAFLKISEPRSARYASEHFGQQEVEITRYTHNWGSSTSTSMQGSSSTSSRGVSVTKMLHTRPAANARNFMMFPEANPLNGITGCFDTACIGAPYYVNFPGAFIEKHRPKPDPAHLELVSRPAEHQYLRDWDEADLRRLGLECHLDLLAKVEARPAKETQKQKQGKKGDAGSGTQDGGLFQLLPKRKQ